MAQSISARKDFYKGPKVTYAGNCTIVDLVHLDGCGASLDAGQSFFGCISVVGRDDNRSVIVDFDNRSGVFLDSADVFAAWTNQSTDFLRINLGLEQSWSIVRNLRSWFADRCQHCSQDFHASFTRLNHRFPNDLFANAGDFEVELDTRDSVLRSSNLEVHVAEVIFVAEDIGQQNKFVVRLTNEADRNTGDWVGDLDAGSHQAKCSTADRSHGRRTIGLCNVRDDPHGVWRIFRVGKDRLDTSLGQCSVSNFTATRATNGTAFTD